MKRLASYVLVIALTIAVLILLWQFRSVLILLLLSLMLSGALRPSAEYLMARRVPSSLAWLLIYGALFGLLGLGFYFLSSRILNELQMLSNYLVVIYDQTYNSWSGGSSIQQAIAGRLPSPDDLPETMAGPSGLSILQLVFGVTQNAATVVAGLVIIIVLSLYWSSDRAHFERLWLSLLPVGQRIQARSIWLTTEASMAAYLRSEFVQSLLAVVLLALLYQAMGLHYPILAALLAGVAWLIPMAGFVFAASLSFLAGLASTGELSVALAALAVTALILAFLEFIVEPRLFRRGQFSGLLMVLVVLVLVEAYGLIGFVIAPPLAVALQIFGSHVIGVMQRPQTAALRIDGLEERLNTVYALYNGRRGSEDGPPPEIGNLLERLEELVDEARAVSIEPRAG